MIYALNPIKATQAILAKLSSIEINALLQLGIEVIEKRPDGNYLIKMGAHTFTSKSDTPLLEHQSYWVEMAQSKEGIVQLKRLLQKPALLHRTWPKDLTSSFLKELSDTEHPHQKFKEHLLQKLIQTPERETFQFYTQLLLSLYQGVLTLPIEYGGKKGLLQMRQGKKEADLNQKSVEFYAAMNNLGPIEGKIHLDQERIYLSLALYYPRSVTLLRQKSSLLQGFEEIKIYLQEGTILPFWDGEKMGLLDIKG